MQIDDDLIPSQEDVKTENEPAEIDDNANPEGEIDEDSPHEDNPDASNDEDEGPEPYADEQPVDEQPPRKQSRTSKRIQELANARRAAEERAERAEKALSELTKQDDDGDYDEYDINSVIERSSKATARYLQEQSAKQAREEAKQVEQQQMQARLDAFVESEAEFASTVPDYQEAIQSLNDVPQSQHVAELIVDSDKGPQVAYYLAKHPNEARAVVNMSPIEAAKFIGGIEARISARPARTTTKAPKPVPKVTGKSAGSATDPNNMSQAAYEKWRQGDVS